MREPLFVGYTTQRSDVPSERRIPSLLPVSSEDRGSSMLFHEIR